MKVKVRVFGDVSESVGRTHTVEMPEDTSVISLTNRLQREAGNSRGGHLGEFKVGGADLAIIINGKNIELLEGVKTKLRDDDDVVIMPFVVGG